MALEHLIFVRHGECGHHVDGLTGGWTDTSLTDRGKRQVAATAAHLADLDLADFGLFASDLKRAAESAEIIGAAVGRRPTMVQSLREINNGDATGLTLGEAEKIALPNPAEFDPDWRGYPNAESFGEMSLRMARALAELAATGAAKVLAVGHGFSGSVLIKTWLTIESRQPIAFDLGPASVTEVKINQWDERQIVRLNSQFGEK